MNIDKKIKTLKPSDEAMDMMIGVYNLGEDEKKAKENNDQRFASVSVHILPHELAKRDLHMRVGYYETMLDGWGEEKRFVRVSESAIVRNGVLYVEVDEFIRALDGAFIQLQRIVEIDGTQEDPGHDIHNDFNEDLTFDTRFEEIGNVHFQEHEEEGLLGWEGGKWVVK